VLAGSALLALAAPHALAAAAAGGYRLAGVVDSGPNKRMGFLELPQGGQVLIRLGTVIAGGGRVVEFSSRAVRIAFPDGRTVNIDFVAANNAAARQGAQSVSEPIEIDPVVTKSDDRGQSLTRQVALANFNKRVGAPNQGPADLTQRLHSLLKLPADARIVAVNDAPIGSTAAAIKKIQAQLGNNTPATLNLETPSGWQRVYLMRDTPASP
jgi:hypothetical protein